MALWPRTFVSHRVKKVGFDEFVESVCARFYKPDRVGGRPSIPPGVCFRMLIIGFFEGIDSERGATWRGEDSLALREFRGYDLSRRTPNHLNLAVIRTRMAEHRVDLLAWCLMTNHVHLVLVPKTADGLEGAVGDALALQPDDQPTAPSKRPSLAGALLLVPAGREPSPCRWRGWRSATRGRVRRLTAAAHWGKGSEELRHLIDANRWAQRYSPKA